MYESKKIVAVIPARGGSKGIPDKNIIEVFDRPLIDFTIAEAKKSQYLDDVIVSTDSEKIAEVAKKCGATVPFLRSESLSTDNASTIDVLIDTINRLEGLNKTYDYIVLLQPTQPLRQVFHIDEAIKIMIDNNYPSLTSVNLVDDHPLLYRTMDRNGRLTNLLNMESTVRRQDFPAYYKVNGSIYINKINNEFNKDVSLNDNSFAYIMDSKYDSDIDEPMDLELFKIKFKYLNEN